MKCSMIDGCDAAVSYIDRKGYVYCDKHGSIRRQTGTACRKLTGAEVKRLLSGQPLKKY